MDSTPARAAPAVVVVASGGCGNCVCRGAPAAAAAVSEDANNNSIAAAAAGSPAVATPTVPRQRYDEAGPGERRYFTCLPPGDLGTVPAPSAERRTGSEDGKKPSAAAVAEAAAAGADKKVRYETVVSEAYRALAVDGAHRYAGVRGDLHAIDDMAPFRPLADWTEGRCVLLSSQRGELSTRVRTSAHLAVALYALFPEMEGLDLRAAGLVAAGGAVCAAAFAGAFRPSDLDLFLVDDADHHDKPAGVAADADGDARQAERDARCSRAVRAVGDHLQRWCSAHVHTTRCDAAMAQDPDRAPLRVFRSERCVTFRTCAGRLVQVVLRAYRTASELLHGFDLGPSAVAYDGTRAVASSLGRLALERGVMALDLTRRRCTLEKRLARYAARGFDVMLPSLRPRDKAVGAVDGWCLGLPYLYVVRRGDGWQFNNVYNPATPTDTDTAAATTTTATDTVTAADGGSDGSDYGSLSSYMYQDVAALDAHNVRMLAADPPRTAGLCGHAPYVSHADRVAVDPTRIPVAVTPAAVRAALRDACRRGRFRLETLRAVLDKADYAHVIMDESGRPLDKTGTPRCAQGPAMVQRAVARLEMRALLPYHVSDPVHNTALVGRSREPHLACLSRTQYVSEEDWYGTYYAASSSTD